MQKFKFLHNSRITAPKAQVYQNRKTESSLCLWVLLRFMFLKSQLKKTFKIFAGQVWR